MCIYKGETLQRSIVFDVFNLIIYNLPVKTKNQTINCIASSCAIADLNNRLFKVIK